MPGTTIIPNGINSDAKAIPGRKMGTFTGDVWLQPISSTAEVSLAHVTFTPCARTYWHIHEGGQVLHVVVGSGWVCDKGETPRRIKAGDVVYAAPGTTHWHGADEGSYMTHLAVGLGKTEWLEEVGQEEYAKKGE